jgi:hypothetical protein
VILGRIEYPWGYTDEALNSDGVLQCCEKDLAGGLRAKVDRLDSVIAAGQPIIKQQNLLQSNSSYPQCMVIRSRGQARLPHGAG